MNKTRPRGLEQRLDYLERTMGSADEEEAHTFMDAVTGAELGRYGVFLEAGGLFGEAEPCGKDPREMTIRELYRDLKPSVEQFLTAERPMVEALESAPKPLTRHGALNIVRPFMSNLPAWPEFFHAWLDSARGTNYLRRLNGFRILGWFDFERIKTAGITDINAIDPEDLTRALETYGDYRAVAALKGLIPSERTKDVAMKAQG